MASKYQFSSETTNFARLSRLVVDVICDLLRAVLKAKVPPPGLTAILQSQRVQLLGNLEPRQRHVLYPAAGGGFVGTLEDLDFTLLYRLVRNIQGIDIPPHQNGWGKLPDTADRSLSANIERLRVQRNEAYGHLPTASLSDSEFKRRWGLIRQSVEEIENDALTGDTYVTAVDALLTMNIDPETEKCYIEELDKQHKEVKAKQKVMATSINDVSTRQDLMATNISEFFTRQEDMATNISDVSTRQEAMATNISDVSTRQEAMATDISDVSTRQEAMATDISDVSTRQEAMATDISDVSTRQEAMATNISDVSTRQEDMARDIHNLQDDVTTIKDTVKASSTNTCHIKEIHPDLKPMIETAKARIKKEKEENKFYPTKGFHDAKDKLLKNRVVVIKGNTGDGKTAIAVQLLHWLSQERHAGQPLQIHKVKKLDLLAPNLKLITFIDDIFGEKDVCIKDVNEWNKRISDVTTLFVGEQNKTNFLIITIRNEVFNSLEKCSLGTILTKDNIIDLSSRAYIIAEEKKELLELYKPEHFSWTKGEKTEILNYAPNIGFPQCCQLFYKSEELQKERAGFFENPFNFLNAALSKLRECSALLYLFLSGGMIKVKDLDPNSKCVNEKLLEEAFDINLIDGLAASTKLSFKKKVVFVKEHLEKVLGFLVVKEKHWLSGDDVYIFSHDSIYVAVAVLYGKITPIGYIKNCPRKSLSYITTSETGTNRVVISSDHYTEMCERLLRDFKNHHRDKIGSLDVWDDPVFVNQFGWFIINDRTTDPNDALDIACSFGIEECALHLMSEGVKPNSRTNLNSLIYRLENDRNRQLRLVRKIVVYLDDERKVHLLNGSCCHDAEECASYLLSEGVKPDVETAWLLIQGHWNDKNRKMRLLSRILELLNNEKKQSLLDKTCAHGLEESVLYLLSEGVKPGKYITWQSLFYRHRNDSNKQVRLLKQIAAYLNDEKKVDLLDELCHSEAEECALYLLSEGVKPDKYTKWQSLFYRHRDDSNKQVRLLKQIAAYLNDETKVGLLNEVCHCEAEKCALYLLAEGVRTDNGSALWSLISSRNKHNSKKQMCLLRKIVIYLNDKTKVTVLNEASYSGAKKCVLYLLSKGVKPDEKTAFLWAGGVWNDWNRQLSVLIRIFELMNDESKQALLNKACSFGKTEIALQLLSEGLKPGNDRAVLSLVEKHWNDREGQVYFLKKILIYLNDKEKVNVLNEACYRGAEESALYLLSEGVKPDKCTYWFGLISRYSNDSNSNVCYLSKLLAYLNDETNVYLLNMICEFGSEEDILYLLSEGVKPNKDTQWGSLFYRHRNDSNKQLRLLEQIAAYMNDEAKVGLLNQAFYFETEECALYLLENGAKPNNDTDLNSLVYRYRNDTDGQMCLLKKIVVYLNDRTKVVLLNNACWVGALECAFYLLSEGAKPNEDTPYQLYSRYWNDRTKQVSLIKMIVVHMDDETRTALMNEACKNRDEESVLYLLSEGVKPAQDTDLWLLIQIHHNDRNRQMCLLRKIVEYLNDLTKVNMLNKACYHCADDCALYLLGEGVEPDKDTVFSVCNEGKVFSELLKRDITLTARDQDNDSVLHWACDNESNGIVSLVCDTYPQLVHDTNRFGQTPLHVVARLGFCSMFQTVERCVLNSLYRVEDQQHQCESVEGRTVHRNCACAQYMAQLVDNDGETILHRSCGYLYGNRDVCLYICQSYPALTTAVDKYGRHFLHHVTQLKVDLDMITECETHVKQYLESTGRTYDITTILDNDGKSVLDIAKEMGKWWREQHTHIFDYLVKMFDK